MKFLDLVARHNDELAEILTLVQTQKLVKKMVDEHGYRITTICLPDDLRDAEALSDD